MRTYSGNRVDFENGLFASVVEEGFDLDEATLSAWRRDMERYCPAEYAEVENLADVSFALEEEFSAPEKEKPKYIPSPTFAEKMYRADEVLQDRYDELKNYALRFKKLKSRLSKKFDSINQGRLQFVKLAVAGKTLKLCLNMDIADTDPKFHCKDMRDKKTYVTVPVQLRIKSGRAMRYAKILIDQCASLHNLKENLKFIEVDAMAIVEETLKKPQSVGEAAVTEA